MKKSIVLLTFMLAAALFGKYSADISLDKADGYYKSGETAVCSVLLKKNKAPLKGAKARLLLKKEGKIVKQQIFDADGNVKKFEVKLDAPGWASFHFEVLGEDGKPLQGKNVQKHRAKPTVVTEIGAIFDAEKIIHPENAPEDFDAFWEKRRAELDKVPIKAELKELPCKVKNVKYYAVKIDCAGDNPVTGYLAVPENAKAGACPAVVEYLSWVYGDANGSAAVKRAARGVLALYVTWHGLPVGMGKDYYRKNIRVLGGRKNINDPNKWAMGLIHYRVMRALDYIKTRPEWDKKNLVVVGGSLGGAQTAAAAALDKDVTLALVGVPCFAEFDTRKTGRNPSIPHRSIKTIQTGDLAPLKTGAYFDIVHFAPRTKCEVFVCTGFVDESCPPSNVFAYYNALKCKKTMSTNPATGHYGTTKNIKGNEKLEALIGSITVYNYNVHK